MEKALTAFWRISLTLFTPPLLQAFCPIGRGYRYPCRLDEGKSGAMSEKTQPRRNTKQQSDFPSIRWEQSRRASAPPSLFQQSWDDLKIPQENFRLAPRSSSPLRDNDEYKAYWSRRVDLFLASDWEIQCNIILTSTAEHEELTLLWTNPGWLGEKLDSSRKNHLYWIVQDNLLNTNLIGPSELTCFLANDWEIGCSIQLTLTAKHKELILLWQNTG